MIPPIAPLAAPDALACARRESPDHREGDRAVAGAVKQRLRSVSVGYGLIADDLDELDAILRQLAVIKFHLKFVAKEAREAVNHDDIERWRRLRTSWAASIYLSSQARALSGSRSF
ncbi:hypothetical protein SAMN05216315_12932 [Nitrosospira sp. Nsp18]|uniref:hypothetical protein n=1 Tax=Nitrosospira sp. Nsp18 TaxID=1855334 RepID=UPI00088F5478|nr:hypothetical protein [Nitrosospira sp. Nsp18]SDA26254.1 hypothetical protein SAMN05216315_12932 [Nitrosospira sp. Nsp18]